MSLPLRKIVRDRKDIVPKTLYYEHSEIMTTPSLLPFKELLPEEKSNWSEFRLDIAKHGGFYKVNPEKLIMYMRWHEKARDAVWRDCMYWLARRAEMDAREAAKLPRPPEKEEPEEEFPTEPDWHTIEVGGIKHQTELHEPVSKKGRYYVYVWEEEGDKNEAKFGDHWVEAGQNPVAEIYKYVRGSLGRRKDKFDEGKIHIPFVRDVSDIAKAADKFSKNKKIDNYIAEPSQSNLLSWRKQVGRKIQAWDVYSLSSEKLISKLNKYFSKIGKPLKTVGLSPWQATAAEVVLDDIRAGKRTFAEELAPRFGKTLWAGALAKELNVPLTVVGSYVLSSLTSFENEFGNRRAGKHPKYEQFKNFEVVNTKDEDYKDQIQDIIKRGKQAVALVSLVQGELREDRLKFLLKDIKQPKLIVIDEADYGAHRIGQTKTIQKYRHKNDPVILMTGTSADRAVANWKVDSTHSVTYLELLAQKFNRDRKTETTLSGIKVDPSRPDVLVPIVGLQLPLQKLVDWSKTNDPESYKVLNADDQLPSWSKFAKDPTKAEGFFTQMLRTVFEGRSSNKFPELHVGALLDEVNMVSKGKGDRQHPPRAMMFLPGSMRIENLNKAKRIAERTFPEWEIIKIAGPTPTDDEDWDWTTNAAAEKKVEAAIEKAGKKPVLILSRGMGSRSFSIPNIRELYLAFDGGDIGATIQKMSRVLTPEKKNKIGHIISLSFDPNRDDKFDSFKSKTVENIAKANNISFTQARKIVNPTIDLWASDPDGGVARYDDSKYIKAMLKANNFGRIMAGRADLSMITPSQAAAIKAVNIKSMRFPKEQAADKGKTFVPPSLKQVSAGVGRTPKIGKIEEQKIRNFIAGVSENLDIVQRSIKRFDGKEVESFSDALKIIKKNPRKYHRALSKHLGVDFNLISDLYDQGTLDNDLIDRAFAVGTRNV